MIGKYELNIRQYIMWFKRNYWIQFDNKMIFQNDKKNNVTAYFLTKKTPQSIN